MKRFSFKGKKKEEKPANLNTLLAVTALQHHLGQKETGHREIAMSALAMFLNSKEKHVNSRIIALTALALYLEEEPEALNRESRTFKVIPPMHSTWSNKILLMRQTPIRK